MQSFRLWTKKILGKTHYFGPWSDPQGAVEKYLKVRDYLRAGLDPPECDEPEEIEDEQGETVGQLLDEFLDEKKSLLDTEDITTITYKEYVATCEVIRRHLGALLLTYYPRCTLELPITPNTNITIRPAMM